jgi:hypothetical protein
VHRLKWLCVESARIPGTYAQGCPLTALTELRVLQCRGCITDDATLTHTLAPLSKLTRLELSLPLGNEGSVQLVLLHRGMSKVQRAHLRASDLLSCITCLPLLHSLSVELAQKDVCAWDQQGGAELDSSMATEWACLFAAKMPLFCRLRELCVPQWLLSLLDVPGVVDAQMRLRLAALETQSGS